MFICCMLLMLLVVIFCVIGCNVVRFFWCVVFRLYFYIVFIKFYSWGLLFYKLI